MKFRAEVTFPYDEVRHEVTGSNTLAQVLAAQAMTVLRELIESEESEFLHVAITCGAAGYKVIISKEAGESG